MPTPAPRAGGTTGHGGERDNYVPGLRGDCRSDAFMALYVLGELKGFVLKNIEKVGLDA